MDPSNTLGVAMHDRHVQQAQRPRSADKRVDNRMALIFDSFLDLLVGLGNVIRGVQDVVLNTVEDLLLFQNQDLQVQEEGMEFTDLGLQVKELLVPHLGHGRCCLALSTSKSWPTMRGIVQACQFCLSLDLLLQLLHIVGFLGIMAADDLTVAVNQHGELAVANAADGQALNPVLGQGLLDVTEPWL
ncbi:hypothetical protein E2320_012955 [Naja naja]|nr:hypothetical protein E2320_012955 [Naja naja]